MLFFQIILFTFVEGFSSVPVRNIGYFWHVTDLHYDWTYDDRGLSCGEGAQDRGPFGDIWCDSPWRLINSSINAMSEIKPDVDFIIWTGDNVAHIADGDMNVSDTIYVMDSISDLLREVFGDTTVIPTYGNHDFYPHNDVPVENVTDLIFNEVAEKWAPWIKEWTQIQNVIEGGYFSYLTRHGLRILSLNTNLYYVQNEVGDRDDDPLGQFVWMNKSLTRAKANDEKVMIIAHIGPGFADNRDKMEMFEKYNKRFLDICREFTDVIVSMHFGHDHADRMKIFRGDQPEQSIPIFLAPSVSPWRYRMSANRISPIHNPGIRLIKYDRDSNLHLELEQYYLNLTETNFIETAMWEKAYSFTEAYSVLDLSGKSIERTIGRLSESHEALMEYFHRQQVVVDEQSLETCDDDCRKAVRCSMASLDYASFDACVSPADPSSVVKRTANCLMLLIFVVSAVVLR